MSATIQETLRLAAATIERLNRHESANGTLDVIRETLDRLNAQPSLPANGGLRRAGIIDLPGFRERCKEFSEFSENQYGGMVRFNLVKVTKSRVHLEVSRIGGRGAVYTVILPVYPDLVTGMPIIVLDPIRFLDMGGGLTGTYQGPLALFGFLGIPEER